MNTLTIPDRVAASICYLARQSGLPEIAPLRIAVVQRHPFRCGWCDYPVDELLRMVGDVSFMPEAAAFARLPQHIQRQQVIAAQDLAE